MSVYIHLLILALFPVAFSVIFYFLKRKTPFGRLPYAVQQIIIGIVFGAIAVINTEFGVDVGGATANARDAAPLCAGFIFGGPAGIIAGVIGGVERWFAAYWGAGAYSQVACSVSTFLAGLYAAFLRKFMLDNRRPTWGFGAATAVVMEIIHITVLVLTHISDLSRAFDIVKICTLPMVVSNAVAVMLSIVAITLYSAKAHKSTIRYKKISQQVQAWLLVCVVLAYFLTTLFVFSLQTQTAISDTKKMLSLNLADVKEDVINTSNENLLRISRKITVEVNNNPDVDLELLCDKYDVSEINIVNTSNKIIVSTNPDYVGFDMMSGSQSAEFSVLNKTEQEWVQNYLPTTYDHSVSMKYAGISMAGKGFVQVGYNADKFQDDLAIQVKGKTKNRHVGNDGYMLIADDSNVIVSAPSKLLGKDVVDVVDISEESSSDLFKQTVNRVKSYCMYTKSEGFTIIGVVPESEVFYTRDIMSYINSFMEVLVFAFLFFFVYMLIKKLVVDKIRIVNDSLGRIIEGDMDVTVNVRSSDEFSSLSDDINSTVTTLKHYIDEAATRIDKELEFAKNIQHSALPSVFPAYPNIKEFDIHAAMDTAKEVGGDFYDFYLLGEDKLAFLIADVSGKGIPAAMFMMTAKTMIKNFAESGLGVDEVFTRANEKLCEGNDAGMFVTAWMGILDINTGHVTFANAGHNPPLIYRKGSGYEYLKSRAGFVLAGMDGVKYKLQEFDLCPGDKIYLYTDGVTEATDSESKLYGEDRLQRLLNANTEDSPQECLNRVRRDIDVFVGEAEQFDDITMLSVAFNGTEKGGADDMEIEERVFPAEDGALMTATSFLEEKLEECGASMKTVMQLSVVLEELFVNVAHYAYPDEKGTLSLGLGFDVNTRNFIMRFTDEGIPFDPLAKEDPDVTLSADERNIGGLGIFMVKKTMDSVEYERTDGKNVLTLKKTI